MATTVPLILRGNLKLGPGASGAGGAVEVGSQILGYTIRAVRDVVQIPATLATPKTNRAGGAGYELEVAFLSSDGSSADDVFRILWTAIGSATGEIYFEGSMRDDAVSATNPKWSGTCVVTGASLGGDAEGLSRDSRTFPMTGAPTIATS